MTSLALKVYTVVVALICGAALAWSIDQQHAAQAAATNARDWHRLAAATLAHDKATTKANHLLVVRYNHLAHRTTASQAKLLRALKQARTASVAAQPQSTVYNTVPGGTVYAPSATSTATPPVASAPAPTPAPVSSPPTTRTS